MHFSQTYNNVGAKKKSGSKGSTNDVTQLSLAFSYFFMDLLPFFSLLKLARRQKVRKSERETYRLRRTVVNGKLKVKIEN